MGINSSPRVSASRRSGRRHPLATVALIVIGLMTTGGAYALLSSSATAETESIRAATVEEGQILFAANCASCHGMNAEGSDAGPSLYGVGAASVDFQVATGRMPLAIQGPQGAKKPPQFTAEQTNALAQYVASLAPGPAIPDEKYLSGGDIANGGVLFRVNCAMCHNVAGAGGALTEGKYAPSLNGVEPVHIYEAMVTGPQNMPEFNEMNLSPDEKADIISYLKHMENTPSVGGFGLGSIGPVSEGLFIWIFGLGGLVAITVWIAARAN